MLKCVFLLEGGWSEWTRQWRWKKLWRGGRRPVDHCSSSRVRVQRSPGSLPVSIWALIGWLILDDDDDEIPPRIPFEFLPLWSRCRSVSSSLVTWWLKLLRLRNKLHNDVTHNTNTLKRNRNQMNPGWKQVWPKLESWHLPLMLLSVESSIYLSI